LEDLCGIKSTELSTGIVGNDRFLLQQRSLVCFPDRPINAPTYQIRLGLLNIYRRAVRSNDGVNRRSGYSKLVEHYLLRFNLPDLRIGHPARKVEGSIRYLFG